MEKGFLVFLSILFLSSCGHGPSVTICIPSSKNQNFICHNQSENKDLIQSPAQVDNWIFLSAADERSFLTACANHLGGVKVNVCVFSSVAMAFACFNEVNGASTGLAFSSASNYIGVSPVDEEILLSYCQSLRK